MIRTQISFDKSLYQAARRAAKRQGVSLAELCRRSMADALARQDTGNVQPWTRYLGIVDGGPGDSASVDEVVYGREAP